MPLYKYIVFMLLTKNVALWDNWQAYICRMLSLSKLINFVATILEILRKNLITNQCVVFTTFLKVTHFKIKVK